MRVFESLLLAVHVFIAHIYNYMLLKIFPSSIVLQLPYYLVKLFGYYSHIVPKGRCFYKFVNILEITVLNKSLSLS